MERPARDASRARSSTLMRYRPVNSSELLVLLDLPSDDITRQIAAHQKCSRGTQCRANGDTDRAKGHAEHGASPKREHRSGNEQHCRYNIEADKNHRTQRSKLPDPV